MKKIIENIKHFFTNDVLTWEKTGNKDYRFDSPFNIFPTEYLEFRCASGKIHWLPEGNWIDLKWDKIYTDKVLEVANAWKEKGNIDMAIKVLKNS